MSGNGRKIRTLIVDDEPHARRSIALLVSGDPEIEVIGECGDGAAALRDIRDLKPDLVFLDVQMPEMNGIEVMRQAGPDAACAVVFVTAYDDYAIAAFEVCALDYLLKPFDDERFEKTLQRAKGQVRRSDVADASRRLLDLLEDYGGSLRTRDGQRVYLRRIAVKSTGRVAFVRTEEIDWIEAADQYVALHTGGKSHLTREAMSRLEEELDPGRFQRIHRSALVNLERVKEIRSQPYGDAMVVLEDGTKLKLSRSRREEFERALTRFSHRG